MSKFPRTGSRRELERDLDYYRALAGRLSKWLEAAERRERDLGRDNARLRDQLKALERELGRSRRAA